MRCHPLPTSSLELHVVKLFISNRPTKNKIATVDIDLLKIINEVCETKSMGVILVTLLKSLNMHLSSGNTPTKVISKLKMMAIKKVEGHSWTLNSKKVFSTGKALALLKLV